MFFRSSIFTAILIVNQVVSDDSLPLQYNLAFRTAEALENFVEVGEYEELVKKYIPRSFAVVFQDVENDEAMNEIAESLEDVDFWERDECMPLTAAEIIPYGINMVKALNVPDYNSISGISTCVIDSGYDLGHPDLQSWGLSGEGNLCNSFPCPWDEDDNGHGTHVTGTIAAIQDGITGVVGVVRNSLMPIHVVRIFDAGNCAPYSEVATAMYSCEQFGTNVVNMSLGGLTYSSLLDNALTTILNTRDDILFVAAAGNYGNNMYLWPASLPGMISVACVDDDEIHCPFSQHNDEVDLAAPGMSIYSTYPVNQGSYHTESGTSMSTPHVAGVAALCWSWFPYKTAVEIRQALEVTAIDLGAPGRDDYYGHGLVDAEGCYNYLSSSPTPQPTSAPTPTPTAEPTTNAEPSMNPTNELCIDSTLEIGVDGTPRFCAWVSGAWSVFRCNKPGVSSHCPFTCGTCADWQCEDSIGQFFYSGTSVTCSLIAGLPPSTITFACSIYGIRTTCRDTCGLCAMYYSDDLQPLPDDYITPIDDDDGK